NNYYFEQLIHAIFNAYNERPTTLIQQDIQKKQLPNTWFLSNEIVGMSLYVDRWNKNLQGLQNTIPYFKELGVNLIHIMPIMECPPNENDGGYAVSNFKNIDARFGNMDDFILLQQAFKKAGIYVMLDIVLNHTSNQHQWALEAKKGNQQFIDYYYFYKDRTLPNQFDLYMPEIFPESSPGNFTYIPELQQYVMTVFHSYQWDLNYTNPAVLIEMLNNIFYYANLGIDILRIDAPAFIWKELGTTCQNLPQAHTLLKIIKLCVQIATPGMALLGEAIVAPSFIMEYFGKNEYAGKECDFAYNATLMALQWDALATKDVRILNYSQHELQQKPLHTSWITYTRCHDDIGLGYADHYIHQAGFNAYLHRQFIKNYYIGNIENSNATGFLFAFNEKTQDARISGSLAALCGLEKAIKNNNEFLINESIDKIILMQAMGFLVGGIPMIFYGDELGYCNDYSYLHDSTKNYDNRWTHRPIIDWQKNEKRKNKNAIEYRIFTALQQIIFLRKKQTCFTDTNNIIWINPHNIHVTGFIRFNKKTTVYCIFNFNNQESFLTWYAFKEQPKTPTL
ncbi:MAG: alpha-amylase family glycosyl hydrolase, partial [Sediminibacterium sp.]|nr:alpha-amylase family glycosyl hydrolase [Sediminibacterium sp.]